MSNPMKTQGSLSVRTAYSNRISLFITADALARARYLVEKVPTECQWFHRVERQRTNGGFVYVLSEIFIPKQKVFPSFVDADPSMMMHLYQELAAQHGREEANAILNSLTCWCHSHVNMAASPSGQDNKTFEEFIQQDINGNNLRPQIMMIFNKKDEVFTRLYDPQVGPVIFENIPLQVETTPNLYPDIDAIITSHLEPGNTSRFPVARVYGSQGTMRDAWETLGEKKTTREAGAGSAGLRERQLQAVSIESGKANKSSQNGGKTSTPTNTLGGIYSPTEKELIGQMCSLLSKSGGEQEQAWNLFLSSLASRPELLEEVYILTFLLSGSCKEILKTDFESKMKSSDHLENLAQLDTLWRDGLIYDEIEFLETSDVASDISEAFKMKDKKGIADIISFWLNQTSTAVTLSDLQDRGII